MWLFYACEINREKSAVDEATTTNVILRADLFVRLRFYNIYASLYRSVCKDPEDSKRNENEKKNLC